jgi:hypothetical protein
MALHFTAAGTPLAVRQVRILLMNQHARWLVTFGIKGNSYFCSQIIGGVENAFPLCVDIPRTGGRNSDLPFEAILQNICNFPAIIFF